MPYGSPSRRVSSTIRCNGSSPIRQRNEPSDTVIDSVGVPICACTARRSTLAIRTSCLSAATAGASTARTGTREINSSTVACSTSTSPSAGSTAAMYDRNARFGPTISTPARRNRSRCR